MVNWLSNHLNPSSYVINSGLLSRHARVNQTLELVGILSYSFEYEILFFFSATWRSPLQIDIAEDDTAR